MRLFTLPSLFRCCCVALAVSAGVAALTGCLAYEPGTYADNSGGYSSPGSSGGAHTGVYINGQQVDYNQWVTLSTAVGTPIAPGSYWVDPNSGWAGYMGNATPLVNVYSGEWTQAAVNGGGGYGSPADAWLSGGEWSGRMSSGTIASDGNPYNSVYSVDGEVLTLP